MCCLGVQVLGYEQVTILCPTFSRRRADPWYASGMDWYDGTIESLAAATGLDVAELRLDDDLRAEILDLARIASHDSGARINAPFLCYALGLAVARGVSLDAMARVVRERYAERRPD